MATCWAAPLGDCKGKITGEHLFSKGIFAPSGNKVTIDGAPWFHGVPKEISLAAAVGNILCEHHNCKLGTYADPAAIQLREAIKQSLENKPEPAAGVSYVRTPGGLVIPRPLITIAGPHYGAWLVKTHCNMLANSGGTPAIEYVRYAFSPRNPAIRFLYPSVKGESVEYTATAHAGYVNFDEPGEPFMIHIGGHWTFVTLQDLPQLAYMNRNDRAVLFKWDGASLAFDWSADPSEIGSGAVITATSVGRR